MLEFKKECKDKNGNFLIFKKEIIIKEVKKIIEDNLEDDGWVYWSIVVD